MATAEIHPAIKNGHLKRASGPPREISLGAEPNIQIVDRRSANHGPGSHRPNYGTFLWRTVTVSADNCLNGDETSRKSSEYPIFRLVPAGEIQIHANKSEMHDYVISSNTRQAEETQYQ